MLPAAAEPTTAAEAHGSQLANARRELGDSCLCSSVGATCSSAGKAAQRAAQTVRGPSRGSIHRDICRQLEQVLTLRSRWMIRRACMWSTPRTTSSAMDLPLHSRHECQPARASAQTSVMQPAAPSMIDMLRHEGSSSNQASMSAVMRRALERAGQAPPLLLTTVP